EKLRQRPSTGSGQRQIIVRRASPGERMSTLDGVERTLNPETLVIADGVGPVAIAGVMGGAESEVTEATTVILLESANFHQASLRRTSSQLRLRSEASIRFDKGLSPELPMPALRRATQLLVELAGGTAAQGIIDVYPGRGEAQAIRLTDKRVKQVLGLDPGREKTLEVLGSLGFQCEAEGPDLMVTPPYWRRTDIKLADDLVEEIARITGYDDIPTTALSTPIPQRQPQPMLDLKEKVRDLLVSTGMQEIITYSLTSLDRLRLLSPEANPLRVANPMSAEQEYLRTTLRSGLLSTLAANEKRVAAVRLFEVGRVYLPQGDALSLSKGRELPHELEMLAGVLAGPRQEKTWARAEEMVDFYDAKGILEALLHHLGIEARFEPGQDPLLLPGRTAQVLAKGLPLGVVGELHPQVAADFDLASQPVLLFELDLEKVLFCLAPQRPYHPLPRFPGILRDLALVVDNDVPAQKVQDILLTSPLVREAKLFDLYAGAP
ncbi:MAG: phenylalanine--tRNA ligase subunit beta, partial [Chloroflexota bacterium]|nr:phenylalanine--tRNA ligase subunit beta [Chloroflexota bacterium]